VLNDQLPFLWQCSARLDDDVERLSRIMEHQNYLRVGADDMRSLLLRGQLDALQDWSAFLNSWARLPIDLYMADGGRYRRRRYEVVSASSAQPLLQMEPYEPHFQSVSYNQLNGGVLRYFELIEDGVLCSCAMRSLLSVGCEIVNRLAPDSDWRIALHQFRIEAHERREAPPTPEGRHRDGVNFAMMVMIGRKNVTGGNTIIYDQDSNPIDEFTLSDPLDTAFVNDERTFHEVSPISLRDPGQLGYRDMLVATFRKSGPLAPGASPG
jgi:hypothetical protein